MSLLRFYHVVTFEIDRPSKTMLNDASQPVLTGRETEIAPTFIDVNVP